MAYQNMTYWLSIIFTVIPSVLEYGAQIWSGGLTQMQKKNIERFEKRTFRIKPVELHAFATSAKKVHFRNDQGGSTRFRDRCRRPRIYRV